MLPPHANPLLSDRILHGNICRQWAHLEYQISLSIWSMLRIDQESGAILIGGLNMSTRVGMAIAPAKHLAAPDAALNTLKEAKKILENGLEEQRNQAIHGIPFSDPNDPSMDIFEMHRGKRKGRQRISNKDLDVGEKNTGSLLAYCGLIAAPP